MNRLFLIALVALGLSVPAHAGAQTENPILTGVQLGLPELNIDVTDSGWSMPVEFPAGRYLVTASYEGDQDFGTAAFVRLPDDWSIDDLNSRLEAAAAERGELPSDGTAVHDIENVAIDVSWLYGLTLSGGISPVAGGVAQGIFDFTPGNWAVWADDFEPNALGFTVTGQPPGILPEPESSITITQIDVGEHFRFDVEGELSAGTHVIRIVNASSQPHFVEFVQLSHPATNEQFSAFLAASENSEIDSSIGLPDDFAFYLTATYAGTQSPGTVQWIVTTVEPGSFAIVCWMPDPNHNNDPHALGGMVETFDVAE